MLRSPLSAVVWFFSLAYLYVAGVAWLDYKFFDDNAVVLLVAILGLAVFLIGILIGVAVTKGKLP